MNRIVSRAFLAAGGLVLMGACRKTQEPAVANIGDARITISDFKNRLHDTPAAYQQYAATPEGRRQFLNLLIREKVLLVESRKAGLQQDENYRKSIDRYKTKQDRDIKEYQESLLIEMYLSRLRTKEISITDNEIRRFYDEHTEEFVHPVLVQASHILVNSPDEAERVLARLKNGESFEALARAVSLDPSTAANGGKLSPFTRGTLMPEFENAVFALKDGQISPPTKTAFGYHIIKRLSSKTLPAKSYDMAKDEIQTRLQREKFDQWVTQAQASLGVKINDQALAAVTMNSSATMPGGAASPLPNSQESLQ